MSYIQLLSIHKNLFEDLYDFAGKCRTCNISKKEWILGGLSVIYGDFEQLQETIEYDINREKNFSYANLDERGIIEHFSKFIANFWQIHPFGEGNTRTIAVFAIKYLRTLGFEITNEPFESNSWYFRNALLGAVNELKNHELSILLI